MEKVEIAVPVPQPEPKKFNVNLEPEDVYQAEQSDRGFRIVFSRPEILERELKPRTGTRISDTGQPFVGVQLSEDQAEELLRKLRFYLEPDSKETE